MVAALSEQERRLLGEVARVNENNGNGFSSYIVSGGGTKGSNFAKINLQKRADALLSKGLISKTAFGYEITASGRETLNPTPATRGDGQ